jgi:hypothetical protein
MSTIERKKAILRTLLRYLGSNNPIVEYNEERIEGLRWWAVLPDVLACVPVSGAHPNRPAAYGITPKDVFRKIQVCVSLSEIRAARAKMIQLGICPGY